MQTIRLRVNDKVYEKLVWLLKKFNKTDIEIISEDENFLKDKAYLQRELNEIDNGKAVFYSLEELEDELDKVISKHENSI
ncbi:MAG: tRNA pseudouridine synthase A [Bacteroidota bacterium]|uniref:tRNA pseudouridine synthase A n=1 Tax=Marivirga sp. TaxID=2018662 RepID=UPI003DA79364